MEERFEGAEVDKVAAATTSPDLRSCGADEFKQRVLAQTWGWVANGHAKVEFLT